MLTSAVYGFKPSFGLPCGVEQRLAIVAVGQAHYMIKCCSTLVCTCDSHQAVYLLYSLAKYLQLSGPKQCVPCVLMLAHLCYGLQHVLGHVQPLARRHAVREVQLVSPEGSVRNGYSRWDIHNATFSTA